MLGLMDAFEITRGLQGEFNKPVDPNRYLEWDNDYMNVRMDQEDGFIYINDGDATISIPPGYADRLATIMEIANRVYKGE